MNDGRRIWRGRRRAPWTAALAMLALVVQLMIPAAAMSAQGAGAVVICTGQGAVAVAADADGQPAKGFAGLACQDCVMAAVAALPAPAPQAVAIRYAAEAAPASPPPAAAGPREHVPPKPPSQGPPILIQA